MSKIKYFSENLEVQNKTIILRLDLNVPLNEKIIQDKSRIVMSLPFLKDLIKKKSKDSYRKPFRKAKRSKK